MPRVAGHTLELSDPLYESEGLRLLTVKSRTLQRRADVTLFLPEPSAGEIKVLLVLLHGVYGSHWAWSLKGGVHRTAARMIAAGEIEPLLIVMPSDGLSRDGSGYLPHVGEDAERWIVDEVIELAREAVTALAPAPKVFLAGLSMGGYGALRLGAKYAERFAGISAHSAITRIADLQPFVEEPLEEYLRCADADDLDPLYWLLKHRSKLPNLRFDCGTQDSLIEGNRRLHRELEAAGCPHHYEELPGAHDWIYWQQQVERTLRFAAGRPLHEARWGPAVQL